MTCNCCFYRGFSGSGFAGIAAARVENERVAGSEVDFAAVGGALEDEVRAKAGAGIIGRVAVVFDELQVIEQAEILVLAGLGQ